MRRLTILGGAALALAACEAPVGSNGVAAVDNAENFDAAVASIGCEMRSESDYLPVELQTGMSREEVQAIAASKVRSGQAVRTAEGAVRSTMGACAPDAAS